MLSVLSCVGAQHLAKPAGPAAPSLTVSGYDHTNTYTAADSSQYTNYWFFNNTTSARNVSNAIQMTNWSTPVTVFISGAGGVGALGSSSGSTGGSAAAPMLCKLFPTNMSDNVSLNIAGISYPTATVVPQPCGSNSVASFTSNTALNITSYGGGGGVSNTNGQNGGNPSNCGRMASGSPGTSTAPLLAGATDTVSSGLHVLHRKGYGNNSTASTASTAFGWGGIGSAVDSTAQATSNASAPSHGGKGMTIASSCAYDSASYGISQFYMYCGGGGGGSNTSTAGGQGFAGGGCAGATSSVNRSTPNLSLYLTGYGAVDDSGTSGVTLTTNATCAAQQINNTGNWSVPGNGCLGSGGGSGVNDSYNRGRGGPGFVCISVPA